MFDGIIWVFVLASVGIFSFLSMLFGGLAWLMFGPTVGWGVFGVGMTFGVIWTTICYQDSK